VRDYTKLDAFRAADDLAVAVHEATRSFPSYEKFGLGLQLRRAVVSAAANIVEGCARETSAELARFLDIAHSSAREAEYEISLAARLGYLRADIAKDIQEKAARATLLLERLAKRARGFRAADARRSRS